MEITILNDIVLEVTETLSARLSLQGGLIPRVTIRPALATIEITDDDSEFCIYLRVVIAHSPVLL